MEEVCNVFSPAHRNDEVNIFESSPSNVPLHTAKESLSRVRHSST